MVDPMTTQPHSAGQTVAADGPTLRLLHVRIDESGRNVTQQVEAIVSELGPRFEVRCVDDNYGLVNCLDEGGYDAILLDHTNVESREVSSLDMALSFSVELPVIVLTDENDETFVQTVLSQGADDCLGAEGLRAGQLERSIRHAVARRAARRDASPMLFAPEPLEQPVTHAPYGPRDFVPRAAAYDVESLRPPTPSPRPTKGRWFVGTILVFVTAVIAYKTWDTFFRYLAYGVVVGRTIDISAPWEGMVKYVHVQDGQTVRQDEPLITVDNLSISQQIEQTDDELSFAQAELRSKVSELKWTMSRHDERDVRATTEYFELWGRLLDERATLADLAAKYERATDLRRAGTVTEESFEEIHFRWHGQKDKVAKLTQAVEEMKKSAKVTTVLDSGSDQLAPCLAKIDMLMAKRARLRQQLASGELRSPTNGVVLKRWKFVGEKCGMDEPAITVVEESSLLIVLYFRQSSSWTPSVGETVSVEVPPSSSSIPCRVQRIGNGYEAPPSQIERHYHADEKLLPVYLVPVDRDVSGTILRTGAIARLAKW